MNWNELHDEIDHDWKLGPGSSRWRYMIHKYTHRFTLATTTSYRQLEPVRTLYGHKFKKSSEELLKFHVGIVKGNRSMPRRR